MPTSAYHCIYAESLGMSFISRIGEDEYLHVGTQIDRPICWAFDHAPFKFIKSLPKLGVAGCFQHHLSSAFRILVLENSDIVNIFV